MKNHKILLAIPCVAMLLMGSTTANAAAAPANAESSNSASTENDPQLNMEQNGPYSSLGTIEDGSFELNENGTVDVLNQSGEVAYTLEKEGYSHDGTPVEHSYEVNGDNLTITWKEVPSAGQIRTYATDDLGLPADPKDKAACLVSIAGMGLATGTLIVATGGTAAAFAAAGAGYITSVAGTVLSC